MSRTSAEPSLAEIRRRLRSHADPGRAAILQRFFKTKAGEYGEGDRFLGVTVPELRTLSRQLTGATLASVEALLRSPLHEERHLALMLLVLRFARAGDAERAQLYRFYLAHSGRVNNWDLVDTSAPKIVGAYLLQRERTPLFRLARSSSLWERRIAIVSTHYFIRDGDLDDTFRVADLLLDDRHDLIHKAVGWMLREAGKRDERALRDYLAPRYRRMPRTMLRYAIERFTPEDRREYLLGRVGDQDDGDRTATSSRASSTKSSSPASRSGVKRKPKP